MRNREVTSSSSRRPTYREIQLHNRPAKVTAYIGCSILLTAFVFVIPGCLANLMYMMTSSKLRSLLMTLQIWCLVTTAFVVLLPPAEEIWGIWCRLKKKQRIVKGREDSREAHPLENSSDIELQIGLILKQK
ncbi:urea-proton symporter DUR3-like [Elysia marginata]|uniref:Urea-proton symporter DUR3-like n=1 Tax=Elysia marginata TaxID=1093978 RepID=A0AAV4FH59_9GAST|nr:urea-proton symporter DUR3-like [Elysia marginata]